MIPSPRNNRQAIILVIAIIVASLLTVGALTWGNYQYALKNPGGNDFLVHWMGTRVLMVDGISPYSDAAALKIQTMAYGHPAQAGEHLLRVAYPLYSIVVFVPFALITDFTIARAVWMTFLEICLLGLAISSMRLVRWKVSPLKLAILLLFSVLWFHGTRPIINGNVVILVAALIVAGLLAMKNDADELAGVLFAFATIKPQVVALFLVFIIFWSFYKRRWRLIAWLLGTLVILVISATILIPSWILQNLREIWIYPSYNPAGTPGAAFAAWYPGIGIRLGWMLTGILALLLMIEWTVSRRLEFRGFLWTAMLTLTVSQWIGIQTDPGNFIVLLPALFLVFSLLEERWRRIGRIFTYTSLIILMLGLWFLFVKTLTYGYQPQQSPIMFFPLPAFVLFSLLWVRWWAVKPTKVWFEEIYKHDHPGLS